MSKIVATRRGAQWQQPAQELAVDLRIHCLDRDDVDLQLFHNIWGEALPVHQGRPVRFHLIETPRLTLLQTIHTHVYADATSCYQLTEDIIESYEACLNGRSYDDTPVDTPTRDIDSLFASTLGAKERRRWKLRGVLQNLRDLLARDSGLALPQRSTGPRALLRAQLSAEQTTLLLAAARHRACSIHAFFKLAFLRTARTFNQVRGETNRNLRIWDFFSLRPMAEPPGRNLYDCLALTYPVDMQTTWSDEAVLEQCTALIRSMRDGEVLAHAYRLAWMFRIFGPILPVHWSNLAWKRLFKSNVFLTNPGVCPSRLETFGGVPVLDYVTFPQLFVPARVMFVFSTFRDKLRILAVYDQNAFDDSFEDEIFLRFLHELGRISGVVLATAVRAGLMASWTEPALAIANSDSPGPASSGTAISSC